MKLIQPKTWYGIQWISTISFLLICFINFGNTFIVFSGIPICFTLFTIISFLSLIITQLYTYGYYITKEEDNIIYPIFTVLICAMLDITLSFLLNRIDLFVIYFKNYIIYYISIGVQLLINLLVFNKVMFLEIPVEDLELLDEGIYDITNKSDKIQKMEDKYL